MAMEALAPLWMLAHGYIKFPEEIKKVDAVKHEERSKVKPRPSLMSPVWMKNDEMP